MFLTRTEKKMPAEVVSAVQSAVSAIAKHRDDQITRLNLEALRG
jgi:hypothetical protein